MSSTAVGHSCRAVLHHGLIDPRKDMRIRLSLTVLEIHLVARLSEHDVEELRRLGVRVELQIAVHRAAHHSTDIVLATEVIRVDDEVSNHRKPWLPIALVKQSPQP